MSKFDKFYSLIFEQPAPQPVKTGNPTPEEQQLIKRLHNSNYNPRSTKDQKNLEHLRRAGQILGGYKDFKKLVPTAYALQYANTPQGNAYKKRAEQMGVNFTSTPGGDTTNKLPQANTSNLGLNPGEKAPDVTLDKPIDMTSSGQRPPQGPSLDQPVTMNLNPNSQNIPLPPVPNNAPFNQADVQGVAQRIDQAAKILNMDPKKLRDLLKTI